MVLSALVMKLRQRLTPAQKKEPVPPIRPQVAKRIPVTLNDGTRATVAMPQATRNDLESAYAFGIAKSGSTMMNDIFRGLSQYSGHTIFSLADELFAQGISLANDEHQLTSSARAELRQTNFQAKGYFFIGFRRFPSMIDFDDEALQRSVLLVRDPRDAIVSSYYSVLFSHTIPAQRLLIAKLRNRYAGTEIDDFVLMSDILDRMKQSYRSYDVLPEGALRLRYEDYVLKKIALVRRICDHLALNIREEDAASVAKAVHKIPDREDPYSHVRRALPGDHREKLQRKTIARLNKEFAPILERYNYEP